MIDDPSLFDLDIKPLGQSINDRCANAVKTAGHLVSAASEFAARMKFCKYKIYRVSSGLVVDSYRDSSSVVGDSAASVRIDRYFNMSAETCQSFIDRVVHNFIHQMVKSSGGSGSDIHTGSLADRLKSLEHLNIICCICTDLGSIFQIVVKYVVVHVMLNLLQPVRPRYDTTDLSQICY